MASGSSTTGNILGAIGAVVGGIYGGPVGAAQGYAIGSSIGNAIDPPKGPTTSGPRLADKSVQVSTYGSQIPRFYGTIAGSGNITWIENNQLKETVRKENQGGKGGGSETTVLTYSYSATFFLSLGEGPISGVRRIWCGDKLIYNAGSGSLDTIIASNKAARKIKFYLGTDNQMPDSRYQADVGVANASAFRGEAYIAFYDFELADYGNTLQAAQFKVEIVTSANYSAIPVATDSLAYDRNQTNISFLPKPYYVDSELVRFYSPNWDNAYPDSSSFNIYEIRHGFGRLASVQPVAKPSGVSTITFVPPIGTTDNVDEYFRGSDDVIKGSNARFSGPDGCFCKRSGSVAALSVDGGGNLFYSESPSDPLKTISIAHSAGAVLIAGNGSVYTASDTAIKRFDYLLNETASLSVSLTTVQPGQSFLLDDGKRILLVLPTGKIHFFPYDLSERIDGPSIPAITVNYYSSTAYADGDYLVRSYANPDDDTLIVEHFTLALQSANLVPLSYIVGQEAILSGMIGLADVDTSLLTNDVRGYRVLGGSLRSAIEPLQGAFPFDVIQSGYKIKFVSRGQSASASVSYGDLGADEGVNYSKLLIESREMDSQLPVRTRVKYLDSTREYAISEQYADRLNTNSVNMVDREFPIVLSANQAAGVAEVLNFLPWLERSEYKFSIPPSFLSIEPSDVVSLVSENALYSLRITEANYLPTGVIECTGRPNNAAVYSSEASGSEAVPPSGDVLLNGSSLMEILDIPVIDETIQNQAGYSVAATGYTSGWSGCVMYRSIDSGQTWADIQGFIGKGTIGYARDKLLSSTGNLIQYGGSITVDLVSGQFESVTESQMLNGSNYCAYGADGRWEIIRFKDALLNADGSYTISGFIRGDKGTEFATWLHADGDVFVLLNDPDNAFVSIPTSLIGVSATYRAASSGAEIDSAIDIYRTYSGVNLSPLSAVHASANRDGSGNLSMQWVRRTRIGGEWRSNVDAGLGETTEAYEVDIMDGSTVKRTISSSTQSATYTAAHQIADFGSPQPSVTVRIYQMSATVGRGYPLEVTL